MPLRRDRLTSDVGPDASGSNPGIECTHMPERSGMDAAPCTVGASACPRAGVAAAAASVTTARNFCRRKFMLSSLSSLGPCQHSDKLHPLRVRLEAIRDVGECLVSAGGKRQPHTTRSIGPLYVRTK